MRYLRKIHSIYVTIPQTESMQYGLQQINAKKSKLYVYAMTSSKQITLLVIQPENLFFLENGNQSTVVVQ